MQPGAPGIRSRGVALFDLRFSEVTLAVTIRRYWKRQESGHHSSILQWDSNKPRAMKAMKHMANILFFKEGKRLFTCLSRL